MTYIQLTKKLLEDFDFNTINNDNNPLDEFKEYYKLLKFMFDESIITFYKYFPTAIQNREQDYLHLLLPKQNVYIQTMSYNLFSQKYKKKFNITESFYKSAFNYVINTLEFIKKTLGTQIFDFQLGKVRLIAVDSTELDEMYLNKTLDTIMPEIYDCLSHYIDCKTDIYLGPGKGYEWRQDANYIAININQNTIANFIDLYKHIHSIINNQSSNILNEDFDFNSIDDDVDPAIKQVQIQSVIDNYFNEGIYDFISNPDKVEQCFNYLKQVSGSIDAWVNFVENDIFPELINLFDMAYYANDMEAYFDQAAYDMFVRTVKNKSLCKIIKKLNKNNTPLVKIYPTKDLYYKIAENIFATDHQDICFTIFVFLQLYYYNLIPEDYSNIFLPYTQIVFFKNKNITWTNAIIEIGDAHAELSSFTSGEDPEDINLVKQFINTIIK